MDGEGKVRTKLMPNGDTAQDHEKERIRFLKSLKWAYTVRPVWQGSCCVAAAVSNDRPLFYNGQQTFQQQCNI